MIKAGILEIANIFVVNKADIDGHSRAISELRGMLSLGPKGQGGWKTPIVATVAVKGEGIQQLWEAILAHRKHLESSGQGRELAAQRLRDETAEVAAELARERARHALAEDPGLAERLLREGSPYRVAEEILGRSTSR
jgi:LAO/AO transport system kinase